MSIGALKLLIAGDLYAGGHFEKALINQPDICFENIVGIVTSHDLGIVNIESPFTYGGSPIKKIGPHLKASPDCIEGIMKAGFNVFSLANNHILDMGEDGLKDTMQYCNNNGVMFVGVGNNIEEASKPLKIELNGVRLGIIAMADQEFSIASKSSAGAHPLDPIKNYYQIEKIKNQVDFILILIHGGTEYYPLPSPRFREICRFYVNAGANAIVCHHPHISSGYEIYKGAPIIYSTGNFLFDSQKNHEQTWNTGYMVSLSIKPNVIESLQLIPYKFDKKDAIVSLLTGDQRDKFLKNVEILSRIIEDDDQILAEWNNFCDKQRVRYLSEILCLTKIEKVLLRLGLWPFWRISRSKIPALLNLGRCYAHQEILETILSHKF